ncbi:UNVERIFIED_CONTAM: putative apyrase 7 [Sesamum calycinum]|uniref:Apyrase 7 n=1 Tax=Sesamum calycinum TaxID=2727403 RepID=A0AAW2RPN0_9LAMI
MLRLENGVFVHSQPLLWLSDLIKATRLSAPRTSNLSYKSPGLPPLSGSLHGYTFSGPEKKTNLRLSSSLQDLSAYRQLDTEGDLLPSPRIERSSSRALTPKFLQQENGASSFSKEKASPISSGRKKWVRVLCVSSVYCCSLVYVTPCYSFTRTGLEDHPGFQRKSGSQRGRAYNRMETEPGFDKLVTFESKVSDHEETSLKLSIGPVNHHLSAYSLAGYGLNDAFDKSVSHLLKKFPQVSNADLVSGKVEIKHPCLQSGYKAKYLCSHCSSIRLKDGNPIGGKRLPKGGKTGVPVQLIGTPKWEECSALAKVAVNLSEWSDHSPGTDCELQPCALEQNLPRPHGQFYAMSGFYVVYRFFNLTPDAALDDVLEKGREFCEKTWDVARKSVVPQPFIEQYCFRAPYVVRLLREGLHITDSHVIIGSGSITWTLGVALFEAGKEFPYREKSYSYQILRVKIDPIILLAILFASLFALFCAFSCIGNWWMPKFLRRSYLPLFRHNSVTSTSVLNLPAPFRFQRWSPINTGDGRTKMPLSPTVASSQQRQFDTGLGFGGGAIQLAESSLYSSSSSVAHSYSSGSLGQMQFENSNLGSIWTPNRSQMRLQSRRSQSREDLNSSIAEAHLAKV